jgi:predicted transcriptional regulator
MTNASLDEYDLWLLEAAAEGYASVEELSENGNVPKSTAYRRVPVLAQRGLLQHRKRDSGIGRPALVYTITDEGIDELREFTDGLRQTLDRLNRLIGSRRPDPGEA